ncbi:response regulator [Streptomyces sporangiiformans]|uniref:Transcriptional regulatory protein KdpE n=1 Tax=Streptomyces sporangiiformans TaxID=2315329 RepID=A0A505D833_9ACTN|nr:response regulator transcription factor [Streptomyces sporangiiformans]TPQ20623.1 response regulator transcription factor [Streptomyces sporangiiformans]
MTRVLVVDDEPQTGRALVSYLEAREYEVDVAADGATGLRLAAARNPDVIVLSLGLPDMDGVEVLRELRGRTRAPILVLSARSSSDEKAEALDAGADDYVTRPFDMDALLALLGAVVRRAEPTEPTQGGVGGDGSEDEVIVETEEFTVDLAAKKVDRAGRDVRLTPTEWHLLEVLVRNTGRLVGQKQLLQEVWGPSYGTESNYLRVYMAQLRRKLEADPSHPRHFITEPGTGYRFER